MDLITNNSPLRRGGNVFLSWGARASRPPLAVLRQANATGTWGTPPKKIARGIEMMRDNGKGWRGGEVATHWKGDTFYAVDSFDS